MQDPALFGASPDEIVERRSLTLHFHFLCCAPSSVATPPSLTAGYSEPIKYNLSVASNIAKQVYVAEGLAPPTSLHTITSAYRQIWSKVSDKTYWTQLLTKGDWKKVGIYAVEAYGIFTIGEMIGRRSLVGYKLDTSKHGHAHH